MTMTMTKTKSKNKPGKANDKNYEGASAILITPKTPDMDVDMNELLATIDPDAFMYYVLKHALTQEDQKAVTFEAMNIQGAKIMVTIHVIEDGQAN